MRRGGEKFGRLTKMTAHLLSLLEIDLYPPTKFLYDILFAFPNGVALSHDHVEAMID